MLRVPTWCWVATRVDMTDLVECFVVGAMIYCVWMNDVHVRAAWNGLSWTPQLVHRAPNTPDKVTDKYPYSREGIWLACKKLAKYSNAAIVPFFFLSDVPFRAVLIGLGWDVGNSLSGILFCRNFASCHLPVSISHCAFWCATHNRACEFCHTLCREIVIPALSTVPTWHHGEVMDAAQSFLTCTQKLIHENISKHP